MAPSSSPISQPYYVYLVRCSDGSIYTGITTDVARRLVEHNHPTKGAKYTRTKQPVTVIYQENCLDRSTALRREYALKRLDHTEKSLLASRFSQEKSNC